MTTTAAFSRAVVPPKAVILGQTLRAYTLGHALLLCARGNAYSMVSDSHPGPCDLVEAVFICCHDDFQQARMALDSFWTRWKVKLWAKLMGRFDVPTQMIEFRDWLNEQSQMPVPIQTSGKASRRAPGAPFLLRLYQHLRFTRNLPENDCWNYQLGRAIWDWSAMLEAQGAVELCNDSDLKVLG